MGKSSSATEVFTTPELCGLIFDHLDRESRWKLQSLSRGTRINATAYISFKRLIMHREANTRPTVRPEHDADSDDPKNVRWRRVQTGEQEPADDEQDEQDGGQGSSNGPGTGPPPPPALTSLARRRSYSPGGTTRASHLSYVTMNWVLETYFPKFSYYPLSNLLGFEEEVPMGAYFTNPDASYRPLLLMVPPLSEVNIVDSMGRECRAANEKGVTMGDVVDALFTATLD